MYCHVTLYGFFLCGTCMAIYGTVVCYNMAPKWPLAALRVTRLWPKDHQRHELHQWIVAFRALGNLISTREIISIIPGQWGASRNFHNVIEIKKVIGYILKLEDQVSLGKVLRWELRPPSAAQVKRILAGINPVANLPTIHYFKSPFWIG